MKTKYEINIADLPEYQRVNKFFNTIETGSTYYMTCLLDSVARNEPVVKAAAKTIEEDFGCLWVNTDIVDELIQFSASVLFDSREDLIAYFTLHNLDLNQKIIKDGRIIDGVTYTQIIYAFTVDNIRFNLSYRREGFPTAHCKIVTNTTTSVACDIDGADTESNDDVPF